MIIFLRFFYINTHSKEINPFFVPVSVASTFLFLLFFNCIKAENYFP